MPARTPIEELDLSIGAYNALKALDVDFVDEIEAVLESEANPRYRNLTTMRRREIEERLRGFRGDSGPAGLPVR